MVRVRSDLPRRTKLRANETADRADSYPSAEIKSRRDDDRARKRGRMRRHNAGYQWLVEVYEVLGHPVLREALRILQTAGLDGRSAHQRLAGIRTSVHDARHLMPTRVELEIERQRESGEPTSLRRAAETVAHSAEVPATSLAAATRRVEDASRDARRHRRRADVGAAGDAIRMALVRPHLGRIVVEPVTGQPVSPMGIVVPMDYHWRRLLAEGAIEAILVLEFAQRD